MAESPAHDDAKRVLDTPEGERAPASFQQVVQGFKGTAFLDVGMLLPMYCGHCKGDGCDTCDGEGVVLVRITSMKLESPGALEPNDDVQLEATLTYDQSIPPLTTPPMTKPSQLALDFMQEPTE